MLLWIIEQQSFVEGFVEAPSAGIGRIVVIEAEFEKDAWHYARSIGVYTETARWKMRDRGVPPDETKTALTSSDNFLHDHPSTYLHFHDGTFFCLNGLYHPLTADLYKVCRHGARL